uniref:Transposase n=1 Tax=Heterorhabditis bacteriophora TaxID=37862 RepID=A0A1I7XP58_HETBA
MKYFPEVIPLLIKQMGRYPVNLGQLKRYDASWEIDDYVDIHVDQDEGKSANDGLYPKRSK